MIYGSEVQAAVVGMALGAAALAYLLILTIVKISISRRRARNDKPTNS